MYLKKALTLQWKSAIYFDNAKMGHSLARINCQDVANHTAYNRYYNCDCV